MLAKKALAGTAGAPKSYVEDVFSTYLYTGNATARSIVNGIDLATEGGLVWIKNRGQAENNALFDTDRGINKHLFSNTTGAQVTYSGTFTSFNSDGFSLGTDSAGGYVNVNNQTYVSWTFRQAKKFFDVVTYTGTGSPRTVSHNLGSAPGCIIVKRYDSTGSWAVWHRSGTQTNGKFAAFLNTSGAYEDQAENLWGSDTVAPDMNASTFGVGTAGSVNSNGFTYVAYLFAHDAGGFGDAGSDNIITCGSFTSDVSSNATVNLGWEPQWIIMKQSSDIAGWWMVNNMMPFVASPGTTTKYLSANLTDAEADWGSVMEPTATGFKGTGLGASRTYIYIAIRRGPMKTPTSGTSVYNAIVRDGTAATATITGVGFPVDLIFTSLRPAGTHNPVLSDRLRGAQKTLSSRGTQEEQTETAAVTSFASMDGVSLGADNTGFWNGFNSSSGSSYVNWFFKRAPGFFDVVCYTGTGSATTFSHNLGVAPELMIVKQRNSTNPWRVYSLPTGATKHLALNTDAAETTSSANWNDTAPTSTVFTVGTGTGVNGSGSTYVNYLFASVSGVSKIGTYTGNGSSVTVTTDFQPRFILVKRTDSTGNWIVSDSARGLVAGSDPALFLNTTDAETTGQDWVDVSSTSFTVNETALNANVNTATYLYLAVA